MDLHRVVSAVEVLALVIAGAFLIMLFANEPDSGAHAGSIGAQLFAANCATCHGADGGGGTGPKLAGVVAQKYPNIDDQIAIVTNGKTGGMPSFGGDLTPKQIQLVVEYTRTELG